MNKKEKKVKIRQFWSIDPSTKIEGDTTQEYNRTQQRREFIQELEDELNNLDNE